MTNRDRAFRFELTSEIFNQLGGYSNLDNSELSRAIESWNLLDENNRKDDSIISRYQEWSFTVSFLKLINAWQWFFSGILLARQACLPAQSMQMYYYSIFFSYGSFLSAQFKGHYTLKTNINEDYTITKTRQETWLDLDEDSVYINVKNKGRGGEHEIRASWFYSVFKKWDLCSYYPDVLSFCDDKKFHSDFRNMYTYSISDMAEELFFDSNSVTDITNEILISLWNREGKFEEYYPEEFWALEHIKVVSDLHSRLLTEYSKASPYTVHQILLINKLCEHHKKTGLFEVLQESIPSIINLCL